MAAVGISKEIAKEVYTYLSKVIEGCEIRDNCKKETIVYIKIISENRLIALSNKYMTETYGLINSSQIIIDDVLYPLLTKYPRLVDQLKIKDSSVAPKVFSDKEITPLIEVSNLFQNAFKTGNIKWDASLKLYVFTYKTKGKKKKLKEIKRVICKSISEKISSLKDMGLDYFNVLRELKEVDEVIKDNISDVFITKDGYIYKDGSFVERRKFEEMIDKWNSYYRTKVFTLKNNNILCSGKSLTKSDFYTLIDSKDLDNFLKRTKGIVKNTMNQAVYSGGDILDSFFNNDFDIIMNYIDGEFKIIEKTYVKDLNFIKRNSSLFIKDFSHSIDKILLYKRNDKDVEIKVLKYYKSIEVSKGPYTFLYTERGDEIIKEDLSEKFFTNSLKTLSEINESKVISVFNSVEKDLNSFAEELSVQTESSLLSKYPDEREYIENISKKIHGLLLTHISGKLSIKNNASVAFNDMIYEGENSHMFNNYVNLFLGSKANLYLKREEDRIEELLNSKRFAHETVKNPVSKIIVDCISKIQKKGITTYANILVGKKNIEEDSNFYGSLKNYTYENVIGIIDSLIDNKALKKVERKASFGKYTSIEIGDLISKFGLKSEISSTKADKEAILILEENKPNEYLALSQYIDKTNNLKDIKKYYILNEIGIEDIKFLVSKIKSENINVKKIIKTIEEIFKDCNRISNDTLYYIRFQISASKSPKTKLLLESILNFENIKNGGANS